MVKVAFLPTLDVELEVSVFCSSLQAGFYSCGDLPLSKKKESAAGSEKIERSIVNNGK